MARSQSGLATAAGFRPASCVGTVACEIADSGPRWARLAFAAFPGTIEWELGF